MLTDYIYIVASYQRSNYSALPADGTFDAYSVIEWKGWSSTDQALDDKTSPCCIMHFTYFHEQVHMQTEPSKACCQ